MSDKQHQILKSYHLHRDELMNYLHRKLGSDQDVQDILQELNLRILEMPIQQLEEIREFRAYFYTAIKNLVVDQQRKQVVRRRGVVDDALDCVASHLSSPDRILDSQQRLEVLKSVIERLPARCREVFLLYKFRNLTQKQISQELGISLNMVEKHVVKAHEKIREAMRQEEIL